MAEWVYQGEYMLALSELPHQQQEEYIMELHLELHQCMVRTGLQGAAVPVRPTPMARDILVATHKQGLGLLLGL